MDAGVKTIKDMTPQVMSAIRLLATCRVMVGVPAENAFRSPDPSDPGVTPPNNAEIAYINEFGEPAARIPPRPFLVPAIETMKPEIVQRLGKAADFAIRGQPEKVDQAFHALGLRAQAAVRRKITQGPFQPLASYTLYRRRQRGHKGAKPLIETGKLRQAITYIIRRVRPTD
jgi:hypothetical protein